MSNLTAGRSMLKNRYDIFPIPSGNKLFEILEKVAPDLILLDIEMPGMSGYEAIEKLKAEKETRDIPVIFLTARNDPGSELEGLNMGAVDYIYKPFSPPPAPQAHREPPAYQEPADCPEGLQRQFAANGAQADPAGG
jgi:putative two-component system response regulator